MNAALDCPDVNQKNVVNRTLLSFTAIATFAVAATVFLLLGARRS